MISDHYYRSAWGGAAVLFHRDLWVTDEIMLLLQMDCTESLSSTNTACFLLCDMYGYKEI